MYWFRLRAPGIAATLLVWLAVLGASLVAPHPADGHDADSGAILVWHDASAHRLHGRPAAPGRHPEHCLVCHWVRAFRPRTEVRFVSTLTADAGISVPVALFTISRRAPVAQPPLRSPPTSPALA
jgi:hypothetical protein